VGFGRDATGGVHAAGARVRELPAQPAHPAQHHSTTAPQHHSTTAPQHHSSTQAAKDGSPDVPRCVHVCLCAAPVCARRGPSTAGQTWCIRSANRGTRLCIGANGLLTVRRVDAAWTITWCGGRVVRWRRALAEHECCWLAAARLVHQVGSVCRSLTAHVLPSYAMLCCMLCSMPCSAHTTQVKPEDQHSRWRAPRGDAARRQPRW
jgi:hypothetical protein